MDDVPFLDIFFAWVELCPVLVFVVVVLVLGGAGRLVVDATSEALPFANLIFVLGAGTPMDRRLLLLLTEESESDKLPPVERLPVARRLLLLVMVVRRPRCDRDPRLLTLLPPTLSASLASPSDA